MSEAPEKIWAHKPVIFDDFDIWTEYEVDDATQYTRTDIADTRIAELEVKLEKAVEVLTDISEGRFSIMPPPDYVTDPQPSPQKLARATLEALTAEGEG